MEQTILELLKKEPLGKPVRVSTFEICRQLNGIRERRFCHKDRTSEKRGNGNYGGAQNPTCDCSNDITNCCKISWRTVFSALKKLERKGILNSSRRRCIDTKRMPWGPQVSKDIYRLWEISSIDTKSREEQK